MQTLILNKHKLNQGFSLIEVLVALSIFTIVVTISVGALMALITSGAKARSTQAVMTNISYTLDSMTRDIRTGSDYYCGDVSSLPTSGTATHDCTNSTGISFNESGSSLTSGSGSSRIAFSLNSSGVVMRRLGTGSWGAVTSPDITITTLRFDVTGSTRGDAESPTVTIYLAGYVGEDDAQGTFDVQTTVVQQVLDI
jgi:prepilin-type N-terminal cleavage/methylation domain-containing protein